ncbi:MAG: molybdenum cofactor biosynthesis protein B [Eggerthellaceae bacterium]
MTCSDTRGMKEDTAGAALETLIAENGWECKSHVVVPDERPFIASAIVRACDEQDVDVVLTCGGSGLAARRDARGHDGRVRSQRARHSRSHARAFAGHHPYAMLSRALCMQRGRHLVINLPGSEKAARENWDGVVKALPHAVKMMAGGGH